MRTAPSPLAVSKAAHVLAPHYPLHTLCTPSAHCSRAPSPTALTRARPSHRYESTNDRSRSYYHSGHSGQGPRAQAVVCDSSRFTPPLDAPICSALPPAERHGGTMHRHVHFHMTVAATTAAPEVCTTSAAWAPTATIVALVSRARRRRARRRRRRKYPTGSVAPRHQRRNSRLRGSSRYFSASASACYPANKILKSGASLLRSDGGATKAD